MIYFPPDSTNKLRCSGGHAALQVAGFFLVISCPCSHISDYHKPTVKIAFVLVLLLLCACRSVLYAEPSLSQIFSYSSALYCPLHIVLLRLLVRVFTRLLIFLVLFLFLIILHTYSLVSLPHLCYTQIHHIPLLHSHVSPLSLSKALSISSHYPLPPPLSRASCLQLMNKTT